MKKSSATVIIETPEHFELQFKLAGIGTRITALLIDKLIQFAVVLSLLMSYAFFLYLSDQISEIADFMYVLNKFMRQWFAAVLILIYGIISLGYFIFFEYIWSGRTPGKKRQAIRVIRSDGRPLSFVDSAIRNILRFFDLLAEVYPIGLIVVFLDKKRRRLGDLAAGTLVIEELPAKPPALPNNVEALETVDPEIKAVVMQMNMDDFRLIAKFLSRRESLDQTYRAQLAGKILHKLTSKIDHSGRPDRDPEKTLESLHQLYMQRVRIF